MSTSTVVRISPEPTQTRILITQGPTDIGKVVLPLTEQAHPRALVTVLEGLSLFLNERLCVVLCVDESSSLCGSVGLLDDLGHGGASLFYEVGVAARLLPPSRQGRRPVRLARGGDFQDLRCLTAAEHEMTLQAVQLRDTAAGRCQNSRRGPR